MAMSIEELDKTVQSFYEGRGETVGASQRPSTLMSQDWLPEILTCYCETHSKNRRKRPSTR